MFDERGSEREKSLNGVITKLSTRSANLLSSGNFLSKAFDRLAWTFAVPPLVFGNDFGTSDRQVAGGKAPLLSTPIDERPYSFMTVVQQDLSQQLGAGDRTRIDNLPVTKKPIAKVSRVPVVRQVIAFNKDRPGASRLRGMLIVRLLLLS